MITINNLQKQFGNLTAVDIPSLSVGQGEIVGLVGNNGAGKTTLFRLLLDLYKADGGEIQSKGVNVAKSEDWKYYTGAFVDSGFLIEFLTPEEYFYFIGECHDIKKQEVDARLQNFEKFMASEILGKKKYIHALSMGNKQKVGIIGAMLIHPEVLVLDEPFNYLDPSSQVEISRLLVQFNKQYGTTMLLSSHNLEHITDISSRVLLMEKGKVIKDIANSSEELLAELKTYFSNQ